MAQEVRFAFGQNWRDYAAHVGTEQLAQAQASIEGFLGPHLGALKGGRVLDVGCGSGVFCVAMANLGAAQVVGVDIDPHSVDTSRSLVARLKPAAPVTLLQGSALDQAFMQSLGAFQLVYAWGSLHHTGDLWRALHNTALTVAPSGLLWTALYNKTRMSGPWTHVKRIYNQVPPAAQTAMTAVWFGMRAAVRAARRKPVFRVERGMFLWHDARDWLGGYPYEAASPSEVDSAMHRLGGVRLDQRLTHTLGCSEFLYRMDGARAASR